MFGENTIKTCAQLQCACIGSFATLCCSSVFSGLHFVERDNAGNISWHSGWFWFLPLTYMDLVDAWLFLLDFDATVDLCLVTLLNWTVGILTLLN